MKLPEVKGIKKIRDFKICQLWLEGQMSRREIAEKFKLHLNNVERILYQNRAILILDKQYEKTKRIRWLKKQINLNDKTNHDTADLIEQLRKELEGTAPLIDQSEHKHFTIEVVRNDGREDKSPFSPEPRKGVAGITGK